MKRLLLFSVIIVFLSSCKQIMPPVKDLINNIKNKHSEKHTQKKRNQNKTFIIKKYYEKSRALKSEITIKNKMKNGPAKKYYPTGELHTLVNYVDNIITGITYWYYRNGQPYRVTPYVNGKINGIRKIYYKNGKIQAEIPYKNGKLIEGTKEYSVQGKVITKPKIIFLTKNNLLANNAITLICKIDNSTTEVTFQREIIDTQGEKRLLELKTDNGIAKLDFHIPSASNINKEIVIYANVKSSFGNPYLLKSRYRLKVDTR